MRAFRGLVVASALFASGCASDHYDVLPSVPGSPARLSRDLHACKQWAIREHFARENPGGSATAGVVAGAVGGMIYEAAQPEANNPNRLTERCMRQRGYSGTSAG